MQARTGVHLLASLVGIGLPSCLGTGPPADKSRVVDQSVFPVTSVTFGVDSFQLATWTVPLVHDSAWDVMGVNKVIWEWCEPNPPAGGVHTYTWELLDSYVQMIADGGKRMELWLSPNSSWASVQYPPDWREQRQSPVKSEYLSDWRSFVHALVERYDGDGVDDMPGLGYPLIFMVKIGDEVEVSAHWAEQGGTATTYFELLQYAHAGAKAAYPDVLVARASLNVSDMSNDHPDPATFESRIPAEYMPYIDGTLANRAHFDVMDIHPAGKYTGALGVIEYFRDYRGLDKIYCVDDSNTSPRNGASYNRGGWEYCPLIYADDDGNRIEDIIDDLERNDPEDPIYQAARDTYYADHAGTLTKRLVFQLMSGAKYSYIQPVMDGLDWDPYIWRHAGLFDTVMYQETGDPNLTPKPAYWQFRFLGRKLIGVKSGKILIERATPGTFFPLTCVYELTKADNQPLWVMWHDYTSDARTPVDYTLNSTAAQVRVYETITRLGRQEPIASVLDVVDGRVTLQLTDHPIIVETIEKGGIRRSARWNPRISPGPSISSDDRLAPPRPASAPPSPPPPAGPAHSRR